MSRCSHMFYTKNFFFGTFRLGNSLTALCFPVNINLQNFLMQCQSLFPVLLIAHLLFSVVINVSSTSSISCINIITVFACGELDKRKEIKTSWVLLIISIRLRVYAYINGMVKYHSVAQFQVVHLSNLLMIILVIL